MKTKSLLISLVLGLGSMVGLLWVLNGWPVFVAAAPAAEIHVCTEGAPTCDYASVQDAVDAASGGDVIKVAAGIYTGVNARPRDDITTTGVVTQVVYVSKTVTIRGGYTTTNWTTPNPGTNPTTLDAQGQGRVFYITGDISPTIEGLRITGGDAVGLGGEGHRGEDAGGGMYIITASAVISNNSIFGNNADTGMDSGMGGGIHLQSSDATISGNTIFSNTANGGGGLGSNGDSSTLSGNLVTANTATHGGGLNLNFCGLGPTVLSGNVITGNVAEDGGGVTLFVCNAVLNEDTIASNDAERGGGVFMMNGADAIFNNVLIVDNHASDKGGGMYASGSSPRLLHTTIARNGGMAAYLTVWEHEWLYSTVSLMDTIIVSHSVGVRITGGNTATVNGVLWYDTPTIISQSPTATVSVQNEVTGDPAFVDPDAGDYHIGPGSAARDAGVDSGLSTDIDGQWRPMGLGYDLGADEYAGAGLDVVKQASLELVNRGETLTYTIVVTSTGADSATGTVVTDTLDGWQRSVGISSSVGGCTIPDAGWGGSAACTLGTLAPGTTALVTVTVEVSTAAMPGQVVANTAVVKANETASSSVQATAYVQDCNVRINSGATQYGTVQAAVDTAGPGDVIKVAGTCVGVNTRAGLRQQVYVGESITIRGGYTTTNWTTSDPESNPTTLDALGEGRVVYIAGDISPTIEGLRITGGDATGLGGGLGGGLDAGGGVYIINATATISNNWIYGNSAGEAVPLGGGVYLESSSSTVSGNTIFGNIANFGGGIQAYLTSNTLSGNAVMSNTAHWDCAGMCLWGGDDVIGNVVVGNTTPGRGGGIFLGSTGSNTLVNNIVADNHAGGSGSGLYIDGTSRLWHTTVAHNTGGDGSGIYVTEGLSLTSVVFTNTIVSQQVVGIRVTGGNTATVNGVLWHNTFNPVSQSPTATVSLQNQHWGNPAFVYPAGGDYHIDADSAAIDRGVDAGIGTDVDGESRPIGAGYDLGADEYPCDGVSNVQLSRTPPGDLFTGNTVLFTAGADGSTPFTYTWTLDSTPVGENRGTFEHIFGASGTYTVGVTATNACGSDSDTMVVTVSDPAPQQPDLSQSNKTVNLTSVEGGDTLTYTLVVRNLNAVTATAILTDPIPAHTAYVAGSAQASSGSPPTVQNGQVRWSGQVITGTPVVIQFAVEVTTTGLAVGDVIANVATVDDGLGNVIALAAQSTYNPGYGLSINEGALFTDIPTVTLRYSWNVADDIIYVKFSNDGGFGAGSSGWIPVNATDPTYDDWVLDTYGDLRVPRTVYAKFRSSSGAQYGPFQDDIVYDVGDPQVTEVEIITQTGGGYAESVAGENVIVRVTSSDDNSGAGVVQISHGEDFAQYSEFGVTGATTDVPWVLQSSGEVYVRVVDRAGNVSQVESEQGPSKYEIYLPLVVRSY